VAPPDEVELPRTVRRPRRAGAARRALGALVVLASGVAPAASGQGAPAAAPPSDGEEGGAHGVEVEAVYTLDALSNVSGGVRRESELLGSLDLLVTLDAETALGWEGGTLRFHVLGTHGGTFSDAVGDLQIVSGIEARETAKVYEAWYERSWRDGAVSLRTGLYDVNSEFDVIPAAALFVHSAPGMGSELGNSGRNGPSTFPVTSLAARLDVEATERVYFRTVVADGVPGDPDDPDDPEGTRIELSSEDGVLVVSELGCYELASREASDRIERRLQSLPPEEQGHGRFGKYALGAWLYTTEFDDFVEVDAGGQPVRNRGSWGVYALAERTVLWEDVDPSQGLSAFARAGIADDEANLFDAYVGGGLVYRGLVPERDADRLGLAVAAARLGEEYRRGALLAGEDLDRWEVALELTYRADLAPWLSIQPVLQYVIDPAGAADLDDATVVGVRLIAATAAQY